MARRTHVVAFPWPATGHFEPIVQLLYHFDTKRPGITVTVVSIGKYISQLAVLQSKGDFKSIDLRLKEIHDADPRYDKDPVFPYRAKLMCESIYQEAETVRKELVGLKGKPGAPTAVISDMFLFWCKDFADELGVPWYAFFPCSSACAVGLMDTFKVVKARAHRQTEPRDDELFYVAIPDLVYYPGITSIYFGDIPKESREFPEFYTEVPARLRQATGAVINISEELDAPIGALSAVRQILDSSKVFPIGPSLQMSGFGQIFTPEDSGSSCLAWLDTQREKSVLYVSFGSLAEMSKSSVLDLAAGLDASGVSFLWALKIGSAQLSDVLPTGFGDRTSGRGRIETDWVPQREILKHPATGGFVTHCGWNSVLESICTGTPTLTWPISADQHVNARYIHDNAKIGIAVSCFKEENKHNYKDIGSREIELAARALMLGNEGRQARANVIKMQKIAEAAVAKGGSSYQHLYQFLDEIDPQAGHD